MAERKTREIYLIRHGATALNSESGNVDCIRGWRNIPLSEEGRQEAKEVANELAGSGIRVLVSSDLDRAFETASAVAGTTAAELEKTRKLRPWDLGEFTGKESSAVHPEMVRYAKQKPDQKIPGGESFNEFSDRVFSGLQDICEKYPDECLAIVTHHRVERRIKSWIANGSPPDKSYDIDVMFTFGEKTGHAQKITIDLPALFGE